MTILTKKKITYGLAIAGLLCISLSIAGAVFVYGNLQRITVHAHPAASVISTPLPTPKPHINAFNQLEPYTVALLGYGGGTHEGGKLTDSMMIIHIVPKQQKIFMISIPRDLWIALPIKGDQKSYWKINAAYPIGLDDRKYTEKPIQYTGEAGGGELTKYAFQTVTGLHIDHFLSLDFSGFKKSIDVLKGIDVKVDRPFDDTLYPIEGQEANTCGKSDADVKVATATMSATQIENAHLFPCRYEHLHFDPGVIHMDGETALKYARSRHSSVDGGDFNRAARQRTIMLALKQRVFSVSFFPKILPFISSLSYNLQTDISGSDLEEFLTYRNDLSTYKIIGSALTDQNVLKQTRSADRQDILVPQAGIDNWESVQQWLLLQML